MVSERSLVGRYYAYRATTSVGFVTPVFTLFLLRTLSFTQVGVLSAIYAVLSVVGEVPTGYVGDRLGRRASLLLSVAFTVASLAGFVVASSFLWYVVLYALWALALTFRSGSRDAWLYDALDEHLDAGAFSRVRGRGDAVESWAGAVTMVGGGLLYGLSPTAPFVAAVAFNSLAVVALLSLPKNAQYADRASAGDGASADGEPADGERAGDGDTPTADADTDADAHLDLRTAVALLREQLFRPPLRALVLYVGVFYAVVGRASGFVQPMAIETLGPYAARVGVELPAGGAVAAARSGEAGPTLALGLGVLYAGLSVVASVGGYYAGAVEERLGVRRTVLLVPAVTGVALVLPLEVGLLALPAFAVAKTSLPLLQPVANGYVNDHVEGAGRATTLSAASMLYMAIRAPLAVGAGVFADATTATATVAALGGVAIVGGGTIWLLGDVAPPTGGRDPGGTVDAGD